MPSCHRMCALCLFSRTALELARLWLPDFSYQSRVHGRAVLPWGAWASLSSFWGLTQPLESEPQHETQWFSKLSRFQSFYFFCFLTFSGLPPLLVFPPPLAASPLQRNELGVAAAVTAVRRRLPAPAEPGRRNSAAANEVSGRKSSGRRRMS